MLTARQTPQISHSPSSTAVSAFGSPQKSAVAMVKTESAGSTATATSISNEHTPRLIHPTVRFIFARSPFRFLLAPGLSADSYNQLSFTYSRKGDGLSDKAATPTRVEGGAQDVCDELVVEAEEEEGPWDVQVSLG